MILTLVKGILIGILVSAPMGPIGVLVIQRTLNKGRWHGFFSGLGAMVSDIVYAMVTGLGLHFVTDFIEKNQASLQLGGSAVLLVFGYFIYKSNPVKSVRGTKNSGSTFWQDFATAFIITFSNPLIIFLFIGLFARMNFFHTDILPSEVLIGIFGVALGALVWWMVITSIFGKLRNRFNLRTLFLINRIVGGAIIILSFFGILYTSATQLRAAQLI
ncbi:MAG: LysE family translocator [Bacteroidales bacterium]